jgi:hypothetical protein
MKYVELREGDILVSKKDYLQSSPILDGEKLTIVKFRNYDQTIDVTRNNGVDEICWALDSDDYGLTFDFESRENKEDKHVTNIVNYTVTPTEEFKRSMITANDWENDLTVTPEVVSIDAHYDFFYDLKPHELQNQQIKTDPYFISKQWRVGERDPSGALFHILKTIARFGDKNPKEREIKAIYLQIKRLAELEGVELE